jgi:leucyl/phenylalanyl-tRNA---protein transferase
MVLGPDLLLRAYSIGVFPMAESRTSPEVFWVEPKQRAIIPLHGFRLSHSLRKTVRSGRFTVTRDRAFAEVVRRCADRAETWINPEIEESYALLHRQGHAHSVECWLDGELAGGLYGVNLGAAFFGESMFSAEKDASKVALAWLVARLIVGGYRLLDCQFMTDHLRSLGAVEIEQRDYMVLLASALSEASPDGAEPRGAEFGALDRLLAEPSLSSGGPAAGCVIAQLLGHTS